jgi:serine/threonine protein kinase
MLPLADCNLFELYVKVDTDPTLQSTLRSYFGCLTSGLSYLHAEKVRHRDIKPQNILVSDKRVYLTDFGVSLDWSELEGGTTTATSQTTPSYCAPEVANYEPRNEMSDVWSLGCVFLEIATLLKGASIAEMQNHFELGAGKNTKKLFWKNIDSVGSWIESLRNRGYNWDNAPLDWVASMLKLNPKERPRARELKEAIDSDRLSSVSFCGSCCEKPDDYQDDDSDGEVEIPKQRMNTDNAMSAERQDEPKAQTQDFEDNGEFSRENEPWTLAIRLISLELDSLYDSMPIVSLLDCHPRFPW